MRAINCMILFVYDICNTSQYTKETFLYGVDELFLNLLMPLTKHTWTIKWYTVKCGNFGRWGNFGHYKTFTLSNIFCHLKNNLVVNMEVKGYLQSVICFKRSFIRLDPTMS